MNSTVIKINCAWPFLILNKRAELKHMCSKLKKGSASWNFEHFLFSQFTSIKNRVASHYPDRISDYTKTSTTNTDAKAALIWKPDENIHGLSRNPKKTCVKNRNWQPSDRVREASRVGCFSVIDQSLWCVTWYANCAKWAQLVVV